MEITGFGRWPGIILQLPVKGTMMVRQELALKVDSLFHVGKLDSPDLIKHSVGKGQVRLCARSLLKST